MAIQVDRIDDKSDGFTIEFTVVNKYRRTFDIRPVGIDQLSYANQQLKTIVTAPVEKPDGVVIVAPPVVGASHEQPAIVDITPTSKPVTVVSAPEPVAVAPASEPGAASVTGVINKIKELLSPKE